MTEASRSSDGMRGGRSTAVVAQARVGPWINRKERWLRWSRSAGRQGRPSAARLRMRGGWVTSEEVEDFA